MSIPRSILVITTTATLSIAGWAYAGTSPARRTTILHATAVVDSATSVDNPPPGDSQGDILVFTQKLYATPARKAIIGHDEAFCVRTVVGKSRVCTGIFYLNSGQITITGPESVKPHALAITGGTGTWQGASGEVDLRPHGPIIDQMTFHISQPN
jgi:hypothetical protein